MYRGVVQLVDGREIDIDALASKPSYEVVEYLLLFLMCCSIIGIPYVMGCIKLVRRGEIMLATTVGGVARVLSTGWNVLKVSEFHSTRALVTDPIISCESK